MQGVQLKSDEHVWAMFVNKEKPDFFCFCLHISQFKMAAHAEHHGIFHWDALIHWDETETPKALR